jgi:phosphatidylglycerophosphate synthase
LDYPNHLLYAAIAFPISYVLDCLDGQVARSTGLSSAFGSFLDKTIDFFKVFAITASLAWATYSATGDVLYVFLGYIASFFFTYRFYIKYITVFSEVSKDKEYLTKSKEYTENLYTEIEAHRKQLATTFWGKIKLFLIQNRVILEVEEAELVMFTAVGALFNQLGAVLWILAVSQVLIVAQRLITRGYQVEHAPEKLLAPIKK